MEGLVQVGKVSMVDIFCSLLRLICCFDFVQKHSSERWQGILEIQCSILSCVMMIMTERLLEKEEVGAPEIWDIFHKTPRIPQVLYAFYCAAL